MSDRVARQVADRAAQRIARQAVEQIIGGPVDSVRAVAAGRSSGAWLADAAVGQWIARVPVEQSGRRMTYRAESLIGGALGTQGHAVADWTVVDVAGTVCSVARFLPGDPVAEFVDDPDDSAWTGDFARALARVLRDLHTMPADGFGPLVDDDTAARGISIDRRQGIIDRWFHATIWPFDGSSLADHPINAVAPLLVEPIAELLTRIEGAESGPTGVVHSDLHRQHLLVAADGSLAGLLDFGDAFVGAIAWDFALLQWYYGRGNVELVAAHYPGGAEELERGVVLSVVVGLYKLARSPGDHAVLARLRRCIEHAVSL